MAVITLSRQFGSGGDEIARMVCKDLGYRMFDRSLIFSAAKETGLSSSDILDFSEDNHRVQTFLERLFRRSGPVVTSRYWTEDISGVRIQEETFLTEEEILGLVQKAVISAYRNGGILIVGRGGQVILKDLPAAVHVRIEAPLEDRIQRVKLWLKEEKGLPFDTIETRRTAQDMIVERDTASADYLRRYYGVRWDDPLLYHLVINTGKITLENAAQCIVGLVKQQEEAREAQPA